ncbi:hypothetical protein N8550_01000 [Pirellulaceae bacterium]|nr:hypothetical protein [Pirellulaceae bacterium]
MTNPVFPDATSFPNAAQIEYELAFGNGSESCANMMGQTGKKNHTSKMAKGKSSIGTSRIFHAMSLPIQMPKRSPAQSASRET